MDESMKISTDQKFDIINSDILNLLIKDYESRQVYDTDTMNKVSPDKSVSLILELLETALERNLEYVTGNFYKHTSPYLPHTDFKSYEQNYLNIVIPLQYTGNQPSLIVFDQMWEQDSVTWCMQYPVKYFSYNTGVKGCPYEYPVKELTSCSIDNELYSAHLFHYPKHCLFGLSGTAYKFEPGSIISFDNRQIHCTSKMNGEKLGLSLRFKK
jgi:hypothetical protein